MKKDKIRLVLYEHRGVWRWKIISTETGRNIATGSQPYKRKSDCKRGLLRLITALTLARFEVCATW